MSGAIVKAEEPHPKRVRKVFNNHEYAYGGAGVFLCCLPLELSNYIMRLAVSPTAGVMSMRKALLEYQTSWRTLASLRLVRKRDCRQNDGLNAIFYEMSMLLWMQVERVQFSNDRSLSVAEVRRVVDRDSAMYRAIKSACGRDNAAWTRALTAYKACKKLPEEAPSLTP